MLSVTAAADCSAGGGGVADSGAGRRGAHEHSKSMAAATTIPPHLDHRPSIASPSVVIVLTDQSTD
jgi:hypothetical protein